MNENKELYSAIKTFAIDQLKSSPSPEMVQALATLISIIVKPEI